MHSHNRTLIAKLGFADADKKLPKHDIACQYLGEPEQMMKLLQVIRPDLDQEPPRSDWEAFIVKASSCAIDVATSFAGAIGSVRPQRLPDRGILEEQLRQWDIAARHFSQQIGEIAREGGRYSVELGHRLTRVGPPKFEVVVQKGTGEGATSIGFMDLLFGFDWETDGLFSATETVAGPKTKMLKHLTTAEAHQMELRGQSLKVGCPVVSFRRDYGRDCQDRVVVEVKITPVPTGDLIRQMNFYRQHDTRNVKHWMVATEYPVSRPDVATLKQAGLTHIKLGAGFEEYLKRRQVEESIPSTSPEI